jgi:uncharacterized protein YukE
MIGMNVDDVRGLAGQLTSSAQQIQDIVNQLTAKVHSTNWVGNDYQAFLNEWQSTYVPSLNSVAHSLEDAANKAYQEVAQQEAAANS